MTGRIRSLVNPGLWAVAAITLTGLVVFYLRKPEAYDLDIITSGVIRFFHHEQVYSAVGNRRYLYPPSSFLLLWPLGVIGFARAHVAYLLLETASMLAAVYLSLRLFRVSLRTTLAAATFCAVILSGPFVEELRWSNVDGLLLPLFVASLLAMDRGRWMVAAILLGITFAIKPTVIPVVVVLVLWKQYRATVVALAIPAALMAASLLVSSEGLRFFTVTVPIVAQGLGQDLSSDNIALAAVLTSLGVHPVVAIGVRIAVLGVILATAWRVWRSPLVGGQKLTTLVGLILLATYVDASYSWLRYLLYLLPAMVMLAVYRSRLPMVLMWVGLVALTLPHARSLDSQFAIVHVFDLYRFTVGLMLLLGALVAWVWTWPAVEREAEPRPDTAPVPELAIAARNS